MELHGYPMNLSLNLSNQKMPSFRNGTDILVAILSRLQFVNSDVGWLASYFLSFDQRLTGGYHFYGRRFMRA